MAFKQYIKFVDGEKKAEILIYTLSTCIWCKKTKSLLQGLGVCYSYVDVDLLDEVTKKEVMKEVGRWNKLRSFPTIVINNKECIQGYKEDRIKEALGIGKR
jgi:glutaredoxin-like protein NrdH